MTDKKSALQAFDTLVEEYAWDIAHNQAVADYFETIRTSLNAAPEVISLSDLRHEIRVVHDDAEYELPLALEIIRNKFPNGIKVIE